MIRPAGSSGGRHHTRHRDRLASQATLHVKSDNIAALAFYQKCARPFAAHGGRGPRHTPSPPARHPCRYGFTIDPNGFCKDHYLIDGVLYHAFRLTYVLPQSSSASYFSFLRCTVI